MVGAFSLPSDQTTTNQQSTGSTATTAGHATVQMPAAANVPIVLATASESLGACRDFGDIVDISFGKDGGHFRVAVVNGSSAHMDSERIKCYRVQVQKRHDQLTVSSTAMPSFFLSDSIATDVPGM